MRCLRLARNHASSEHERLIYEGWILYDTGYREEALAKAELSISIQRSFEAFFLKAYTLADTTMDSVSSSHVIQLLEEALRCPSDSLRKGQVCLQGEWNSSFSLSHSLIWFIDCVLYFAGTEQPREYLCGLW